MIVSHYDKPQDGCAKSELYPQHSLKHLSRSQRVVAGRVMKALGMSTSATSNHQTLSIGTGPT
jgi:hypothetical protein